MEDVTHSYERILGCLSILLESEESTGLPSDTALMLDRLDFRLRSWRYDFDDTVALLSTGGETRLDYLDQLRRTLQNLKAIEGHLGIPNDHSDRSRAYFDVQVMSQSLEKDTEINTLVEIGAQLRSQTSPPTLDHHDSHQHIIEDGEATGSEGDSEFDMAWRPHDYDDPGIMKLLLEMERTDVATELFRAAKHGHMSTIETLLPQLTWQKLETLKDEHGRTALHIAILNRQGPVAQSILSKAPVLRTNTWPNASSEALSLVPKLRDRTTTPVPLVGISDLEGRTPLHFAAQTGQTALVKILLQAGAQVSTADNKGCTPLALIPAHGPRELVPLLNGDRRNVSVTDPMNRSTQAYRYRPISSTTAIRLLKLLPGSATTTAEIQIELIEASALEQQYMCLSYTWGDSAQQHRITIVEGENERSLSVSQNLFKVLAQLRQLEFVSQWLWIDAICIDQENDAERAQQVSRMANIFSNSARTLIWLGEADNSSRDAISWINGRQAAGRRHNLAVDLTRWLSLGKLMSRPWFRRSWVLQEVALSKQATMYCGHDRVHWVDFASTVNSCVELASQNIDDELEALRSQSVLSVADVNFIWQIPDLGAAKLCSTVGTVVRWTPQLDYELQKDLWSLVEECSTITECSDSRDRIYALMGLAKDFSKPSYHRQLMEIFPDSPQARSTCRRAAVHLAKTSFHPIKVDYESSNVKLAQDLTMYWIRASRTLGCLEGPVDTASDQGLMPSWSPGCLRTSPPEAIQSPMGEAGASDSCVLWQCTQLSRRSVSLVSTGPHANKYNAAGTRRLDLRSTRMRIGRHTTILECEGFVLDEIRTTHAPATNGLVPIKDWTVALGLDTVHDSSKLGTIETLCRTMTGDSMADDVSDNGQGAIQGWRTRLREFEEAFPEGNLSIRSAQDCTNLRQMKIHKRIRETCWNRRLVQTFDGRLGLVNKNAQPGDRVCILYGCDVPVILRRHRKTRADTENDRVDSMEDLRQRMQMAAHLLKRIIATRRRQGHAWPRRRSPVQLEFVENDSWLLSFVALGAIGLIQICKLYSLSVGIKLAVITASTVAVEVYNPRAVAQLRRSLTVLNNVYLPMWSAAVGVAFGYEFRVIRTISDINTCLALFLGTILHCRIRYRRQWQTTPCEPLPLEHLLPDVYNESDSWYTLIGEAYIHGVMHGEAISWQEKQNVPTQSFQLR